MRARLLLLALVASFLTAVGGPTPAALADPPPAVDTDPTYPRCGTAPDDDGRYCVNAFTRNGAPVPPVDFATPGSYLVPYVGLLSEGVITWSVERWVVDGVGGYTVEGDVPAGDTWVLEVNTGAIRVREVSATARDLRLSIGGNPATGHRFRLSMRPTPLAWRQAPGFTCTTAGCGDDSTVADVTYDGFLNGTISDLERFGGITPAQRGYRRGLAYATNAQYYGVQYDEATNALDVGLANPHLRSPGVVATGFFEAYLPYAYLERELGVPFPRSLRTGSMTVRRGASPVPFTLSHVAGGVRIALSGFHFSTPRFRIKPKPSRPGQAAIRNVRRLDADSVRVRVRAPYADGGATIKGYQARCRKGSQSWHLARSRRPRVVVDGLPRGRVSCQARALNRIGKGPWSPSKRS